MTNIVKEKIASIVFTLYSERAFGDYIERSEIFAGAEGTDGGADVAAFAKAAYETHLLDGSTFAFRYQGNPGGNQNGSAADISGPSAFRLRGILAVCIFLSGMSGLLTDWKDREERRFGRLIPPAVTTMVNIWIPTIYTSAAVLFSLWLTGNMTVSGSCLNHRNGTVFHHCPYQPSPTPWNQHIHILVQFHKTGSNLPVRAANQLKGIRTDCAFFQSFAYRSRHC